MIKKRLQTAMAVIILVTMIFGSAAFAIGIGDLIKVYGIGYLVREAAPQLNNGINKLLANNKVENREQTKVVPIVSIGQGTYIGAAQVTGSQANLDQVAAVGQLQTSLGLLGVDFRANVYLPINTVNPIGGGLKRIYGVAVTAVIDIHV